MVSFISTASRTGQYCGLKFQKAKFTVHVANNKPLKPTVSDEKEPAIDIDHIVFDVFDAEEFNVGESDLSYGIVKETTVHQPPDARKSDRKKKMGTMQRIHAFFKACFSFFANLFRRKPSIKYSPIDTNPMAQMAARELTLNRAQVLYNRLLHHQDPQLKKVLALCIHAMPDNKINRKIKAAFAGWGEDWTVNLNIPLSAKEVSEKENPEKLILKVSRKVEKKMEILDKPDSKPEAGEKKTPPEADLNLAGEKTTQA